MSKKVKNENVEAVKEEKIKVDFKDFHTNCAYSLIGAYLVNGFRQGYTMSKLNSIISEYIRLAAEEIGENPDREDMPYGLMVANFIDSQIEFTDMDKYDLDDDEFYEDDEEDDPSDESTEW